MLVRCRVWIGRFPTESDEGTVHEERMGPGCPILIAQRNDNVRMIQLVFGLLLGTKFTGILSVLYYFSYLDGLTGGGDAVIDENGTAFTQTKEFQIWEAA
ncbi:hypothetical protein Y032_0005g2292 [Ancylostoma ceylanicum]|uniref:Uncharacterized protein n=1 Tax=Ancylostoma ceylanicum TaxID=53326 RepID=A0A016VQI6_9BILA|nr:hypothetical protein Y032_0005g2292 [Ancylostoma ceylanicum]